MGLQSTAAWEMLAKQSAGVCDDMGRDCDDENSRAGMPLAEPKESLTLPPIKAKATISKAVEDAPAISEQSSAMVRPPFKLLSLNVRNGGGTHVAAICPILRTS
jgi:hypothetical protein